MQPVHSYGSFASFPRCTHRVRSFPDNRHRSAPFEVSVGSYAIPSYLATMPSTFDFCLPTRATAVPHTPDWLHEIKYDGYRLRLERDGDCVRLITKGGYNWTDRYSNGRSWECTASGTDRYRRSLANCVIEGEDASKWMVRSGWALSFVRYSHAYDTDEVVARDAHAGLWSGSFIAPWDWRHRNKTTIILGAASVPVNAQTILLGAVSASEAPSPECVIKGNVSRKGEHIYHLPGQLNYAQINMTKGLGERWFCTEAEADAAGWRKTAR
jgi:hypothetical protein